MPATVATRIDGLNDPALSAPNANLTPLLFAPPATAQYMYLDSNGDGIHTAADQVNPAGPTVIDIWLDTDSNRDGSPAVCYVAAAPLNINSYGIVLRVSGGTASWGTFTNHQPSMGLHGFTSASETE